MSQFIQGKDDNPIIIQILPCRISQSGPAKLSEYFTPLITQTQEGDKEVVLHGRRIYGNEITIPFNQKLLVLTKDAGIRITSVQEKLIYWKHDEGLKTDDRVMQMLHFQQVINALHTPIEIKQND